MIREDCFACKDMQCTLLSEMFCDTRGTCKFYKTKEKAAQDKLDAKNKLLHKGLYVTQYERDGSIHVKAVPISNEMSA